MTLLHSPEEIASKQFLIAFRGYDRREVEEFLHSIAEDYRRLSDEHGTGSNGREARHNGLSVAHLPAVVPAEHDAGGPYATAEASMRLRQIVDQARRSLENLLAEIDGTAPAVAAEALALEAALPPLPPPIPGFAAEVDAAPVVTTASEEPADGDGPYGSELPDVSVPPPPPPPPPPAAAPSAATADRLSQLAHVVHEVTGCDIARAERLLAEEAAGGPVDDVPGIEAAARVIVAVRRADAAA